MENQIVPSGPSPVKLKWYQRIHIESQKKLVGKSTNNRILAIDWCKGFSIIALCYYHLAVVSVIARDAWIVRSIIFVWFCGPTTFLFYAGLNIALSYQMAREKNVPFKKQYLDTIRRMLGLLVVSSVWNLLNNDVVYRWDILQCIAFSTILTFPLLKLPAITRFIIACAIFAVSLPLYSYLDINQSQNLLAQGILVILFVPYLNSPLLPTMAIAIIGTVVIDVMYPLIKQERQVRCSNVDFTTRLTLLKSGKPYRNFKILLIATLITIVLCILLGSGPNLDAVFQAEQAQSIQELHTSPLYAGWQFIPDFLVRLSPIDYIYDLAVVLAIFLLAFYYFSITRQPSYTPSKFTQSINFMGQYSLSFFTYGFIFTAFGRWANAVTVWLGLIVMMASLTYFFKFLLQKAYGAALVEWVTVIFALKWSTLPDLKDIAAVYPEKVGILKNHTDENRK